MINVQLACEKSMIEHRSSNVSHQGENVVHAQPSVSHEEDEIQYSNFEYGSSKRPREAPEEDDRKPAAKRIKKEPEDEVQSWAQDEQKVETTFKQNQLEDVRTNITVWLTSLAMQVIKLKKLNHVLDEEYQITHILASLPS